MWRLREEVRKNSKNTPENPQNTPENPKITPKMLYKAVLLEAGVDNRTYERYKKALLAMGWIKTTKKRTWILTKEDIKGNF